MSSCIMTLYWLLLHKHHLMSRGCTYKLPSGLPYHKVPCLHSVPTSQTSHGPISHILELPHFHSVLYTNPTSVLLNFTCISTCVLSPTAHTDSPTGLPPYLSFTYIIYSFFQWKFFFLDYMDPRMEAAETSKILFTSWLGVVSQKI